MPTQNAGSESATPLLELMNRPKRPPRTAAVTPSTMPTTPESSVAKSAIEAVTGSRAARSAPMDLAVDDRRAEVDPDQAAEVVEELLQSGRSQPSSSFYCGDLGGGAAGTGLDGAGAAVGGVHQQEADQDGGEHRADRERQPPRDVGKHVEFLVWVVGRRAGGVGWPVAAGGPAATGRSARVSSPGAMLDRTR